MHSFLLAFGLGLVYKIVFERQFWVKTLFVLLITDVPLEFVDVQDMLICDVQEHYISTTSVSLNVYVHSWRQI